MDNNDLLALDLPAIKNMAERVAVARRAQEMCNTDYWKTLETRINNLILDKKNKWLSGHYSDKSAIILRRKAMGMKEIMDVVKADIGRGRMAAEMLKQRAKIYTQQREQV